MDPFLQAITATLIVSLISFIGIFVLISKFYKLKFLQTGLISFAAGALLGDVFLHMLAEHIEAYDYNSDTIIFIFIGIILMLIVEAYFHCSHDSTEELKDHKHHVLGRVNIIGDGIHNFLDGIAIGASYLVNPAVGFASTIAIILHEIPQELADTAVLSYAGWGKKKVLTLNFLTALTSVIGVILVFSLGNLIENAERFLVPVAIGQFIYIALADLLPEIHKKAGVPKYVLEISLFILGIIIMYILTFLE